MTTPQEVAARLQQAASQGTPYQVQPTERGAVVRWDIADHRWAGLMSLNHASRVASIDVVVDPAKNAYSREVTLHEVDATAGDRGFRYSASVQKGTIYTKQTRKEISFGPGGPQQVGWSFDTGDLIRFVDDAVRPTGLKRRMDTATRIGLGAAIGAGLLIVLGGLVTGLVLLL